ncbi:MAG: hypothetical protein GY757_06310 [bacterium]|nr:hypothetical protein [bacterium]
MQHLEKEKQPAKIKINTETTIQQKGSPSTPSTKSTKSTTNVTNRNHKEQDHISEILIL